MEIIYLDNYPGGNPSLRMLGQGFGGFEDVGARLWKV